jgi:hypothetical protein|tara:strand:+ start:174 stop:323 length:150 start_codon:yes stop_codon:yes gene_type:complete
MKPKIVGNVYDRRDQIIGVEVQQTPKKLGSSDATSYHCYSAIFNHELGA